MTGAEILLAGSMAMSAVGAISSGNAAAAAAAGERDAALFRKSVAERDGMIAAQKRVIQVRQAQLDAEDKRRENKRILGQVRANYGASGIDLAGSPLDVIEDTATDLELDARRLDYQAQVQGYEGALQILGLEDSANLSSMAAASASSRAKSARTAGYINAVGSLARGGSDIAGSEWGKAQGWS